MDSYRTGEISLAKAVLPRLGKGMLCLADRNFFGYELWQLARGTGADLLWRMEKNMRMAREKLLADGSYLSHVYPSERDWRRQTNGIVLRAIDYRLGGESRVPSRSIVWRPPSSIPARPRPASWRLSITSDGR
jgi:hypothetical protein